MLCNWFFHEVIDESVAENTREGHAVLEWLSRVASRRLASMTVIEATGRQRSTTRTQIRFCPTGIAESQTPVPHARDKGPRPRVAHLSFQA